MGFCMTGNYKDSIEIYGGYGAFIKLRDRIAMHFDEEFGKHYKTLRYCFRDKDFEEFNKITKVILSNERFKDEDKDIIKFLFDPDCGGEITYKTCKKIYDLIKEDNEEMQIRYAKFSDNDWQDFKDLLKECYSHRSKLIWR